MAAPRIIVVGGGLAGLSAVIKIAEMGGQVDLFSIVPVNHTAASVTIVASKIITRLKPSIPVVKLRCHSGDIVNEVTR